MTFPYQMRQTRRWASGGGAVRKIATTVYLTMEQDTRLKEIQRQTGRSMAELVRQGVDLVLERYQSLGTPAEAEDPVSIRLGKTVRGR